MMMSSITVFVLNLIPYSALYRYMCVKFVGSSECLSSKTFS